ncbi:MULTISPECIES: hypothetical protein [Streptomyces]|uniref:hypothetical protein n=1 Tax=Streptomyces TaxID=1883 RepID=UPI0031D710C3
MERLAPTLLTVSAQLPQGTTDRRIEARFPLNVVSMTEKHFRDALRATHAEIIPVLPMLEVR